MTRSIFRGIVAVVSAALTMVLVGVGKAERGPAVGRDEQNVITSELRDIISGLEPDSEISVYLWLQEISSDVIVGDSVGVVESVKAASDVYSPLSGTVNAVNKNLEDDPGLVSNSPEEKGWMYQLENIDLDELEELMNEEDYAKYLKTL